MVFVDAPDFSWRLFRIVLNRSISFFFEFIPNDSGNTDAKYVALRQSLKWIVIPCFPTFILFIPLTTGLFKKFILYVSRDNSDFLMGENRLSWRALTIVLLAMVSFKSPRRLKVPIHPRKFPSLYIVVNIPSTSRMKTESLCEGSMAPFLLRKDSSVIFGRDWNCL